MIVGIDPSLSNTAVCIGSSRDDYEVRCFSTAPRGSSVHNRIARIYGLVGQINDWLLEHPGIRGIYIEGYSFNSKNHQAETLAEYGGILRFHLVDHAESIHEVPPATLKKFATGAAKGDKSIVTAHLTKRYGCIFGTNDEYDAFAVYQLGLVAEGIEQPATVQQREAADTVLGLGKMKQKPRGKSKAASPPAPTIGAPF